MITLTTFGGKAVAVFGLGGSGIVTARALAAGGAKVAAWDDNAAARDAAQRAGVTVDDLQAADWSQFKALVLAPGVPLTHPKPHWTVERAKAARVPVIGDVELFVRERAKLSPFCPFIAITGTNGKSTTTALIAHLLEADGRDVQMGGNIGIPILELEPPAASRFYVIELSSFQIDLAPSLKPTVGVLLNVTPDHLDRHGTMANYAAIKERLMTGAEHVAIGVDDDYTRAITARAQKRGPVYAFSTAAGFRAGYHPDGSKLRIDFDEHKMSEELADLTGNGALRGQHNAQNALAALAALSALGSVLASAPFSPFLKHEKSLQRRLFESDDDCAKRLAGAFKVAKADQAAAVRRRVALQAALATFPGLAHRMEEIGRAGKVLFINDSKATNADSTEKALATWQRDIFWIAGGKPKDGGIASLAAYFPRVAKAYLIGQASDAFAATLDGRVPVERCETLDKAVAAAARDAAACAGLEPVVLLSPACASYDQFNNFEVRGEAFRDLVTALPGIGLRARGA